MDLIPESLWGKSLSQFYKGSPKWQAIKAYIAFKEGDKCWICGYKGRLEAHEFFSYDLENQTQKLEAIHHICYLCHSVIHIGRTYSLFGLLPDKVAEVHKHFCEVNKVPYLALEIYLEEVRKVFEERSKVREWKQDFGEYKPEFIDKVWELAR
jgi:hypothetical protein